MKLKPSAVAIPALVLATLFASSVHAQCNFNATSKGSLKGNMTRSYAECAFPGNLEASGGIPSCSGFSARNDDVDGDLILDGPTPFKFAPDGNCTFNSSTKVLSDCSKVKGSDGLPLGLAVESCLVATIKVKCKGIVDGSSTPTNATGWQLRVLANLVTNDVVLGNPTDMTLVKYPLLYDFPAASGGGLSLSTTSAEGIIDVQTVGNATDAVLDPCSAIQFLGAEILDPDGRPFAQLGGATQVVITPP